jgi:hypothetical protein
MSTPPQESRPLIFVLLNEASLGAALASPPLFTIFGKPGIEHPEMWTYRRPSRGTVINTVGGAFLDDFGEGVGRITIEGHTGWFQGDGGLVQFKNLEQIFIQYHARRDALTATEGADPNAIQLYMIDTLNLEASSVYPEDFTMVRSRNRPLLYQYRISLVVLVDLLQAAISDLFGGIQNGSVIQPVLPNWASIAASVGTIGADIGLGISSLIG